MVSPAGGVSLVSGLRAHQQLGSPWAGGQRPPLHTCPRLRSHPQGGAWAPPPRLQL